MSKGTTRGLRINVNDDARDVIEHMRHQDYSAWGSTHDAALFLMAYAVRKGLKMEPSAGRNFHVNVISATGTKGLQELELLGAHYGEDGEEIGETLSRVIPALIEAGARDLKDRLTKGQGMRQEALTILQELAG